MTLGKDKKNKKMLHDVRGDMHRKRHMLSENIKDTCLNLDFYGKPVRMHFKGHDNYRTKVGACCTIAMFLIVISYALFTIFGLLSPAPISPVESKIFFKSLYDIYQGGSGSLVHERDGSSQEFGRLSDRQQGVKPRKFFAFGLGDKESVDPAIGSFRVRNADQDLKVVLCKDRAAED